MATTRRQPDVVLPGRTRMRPWRQQDAAELVQANRDPLVRRYAGHLHDDRAQVLTLIQRWAHEWDDGDGAAWAIAGPSDAVFGGLRFALLDARLGKATVGYWLAPQARGLGIASAALQAGTRAVVRQFDWHRIELYHAVENHRSCAVARRCGYRYEGVMREAMRYPVDGRWSDEHLHARLATDPEPDG